MKAQNVGKGQKKCLVYCNVVAKKIYQMYFCINFNVNCIFKSIARYTSRFNELDCLHIQSVYQHFMSIFNLYLLHFTLYNMLKMQIDTIFIFLLISGISRISLYILLSSYYRSSSLFLLLMGRPLYAVIQNLFLTALARLLVW